MKIILVTTEFINSEGFSGGLANCIADIARSLVDNGNEVFIVTEGNIYGYEKWKGIDLYSVDTINISYGLRFINLIFPYFPKYYLINKKIREICNEKKVDIIQYPSSSALGMHRIKDVPSVIMMATYLPQFRKAYKKKWIGTISKSWKKDELQIKRALYKADAIFSPSQLVAEMVKYDTKIEVKTLKLPMYVNVESSNKICCEEKLYEKKYFLFYGTLGYLKGIDLIAKVLDRLFARYDDVYFTFMGRNLMMDYNGEKVEAIEYVRRIVEKKYNQRIIYISATDSKEKLYNIVSNSLACVLPSRFDNLPNSCIESMMLGKIVIGTRGASFEELLDDHDNGLLIDIDDENQLLEALIEVHDMPEDKRKKMEKKAIDKIRSFSPQSAYENVISFYKDTIDNYGKRRNDE